VSLLALITIAFEVYSDALLTSADLARAKAPDVATAAIAHELQRK
jgi:hypothetical protein